MDKENKVKVEKAELIYENGYAKNLYQLSLNDKLQRLADLASKNERVKTNTVHISLNFAKILIRKGMDPGYGETLLC